MSRSSVAALVTSVAAVLVDPRCVHLAELPLVARRIRWVWMSAFGRADLLGAQAVDMPHVGRLAPRR
jgi:hypothetical protein